MREAASGVVIDGLLARGASVCAYDPVAIGHARSLYADEPRVQFAEGAMAALAGSDALIIVTEWKEFRSPDFDAILGALGSPVVFDGRNLYEPARVAAAGLEYYPIGRAQGAAGRP